MLIETIDLFRTEDAFGNWREVTDAEWEAARQQFIQALEQENRPEKLEEAVIYKWSWELHVDLLFDLLKKAKSSGCGSFEFWRCYYKFLAAYLTPHDPEWEFAMEMANGKYL